MVFFGNEDESAIFVKAMKFILLIRENLDFIRSKESMNEIVDLHRNWYKSLEERGIVCDGNGLEPDGLLIYEEGDQIKMGKLRDRIQGVGGYYIIDVKNEEMAIQIAKECPTYAMGDIIELRPIL